MIDPSTDFSHHEILSTIGKGGMGEVYRTRDLQLDLEVAVKMLPAGFAGEEVRLLRFEQEGNGTFAYSYQEDLGQLHFAKGLQ
jgi:serine/threonine protein kinase